MCPIIPIDDRLHRRGKPQNLYDLATWHRLRGEYDLAAARLREALELNPRLLNARNDWAGVLFLQGRHDEAEQEYRAVLAEDARYTAREAWMKASALPGAAAEVRKRARTRLGIYGEAPNASRSQPTERETHHGENR